MIGRLAGRVVSEDPNGGLLVDVGGVGYEVLVPIGALGRVRAESAGQVVLWVHTHVRQDTLELFGFASDDERRVFRLLIGVPNVGPKTALGVLSAIPFDELAHAVERGDVARLTRVPGVGKKTAERLVLELKEKMPAAVPAKAGLTPEHPSRGDAQKLQFALTNMGYRASEAERAIKALGDRVGQQPLADLLREALAVLNP